MIGALSPCNDLWIYVSCVTCAGESIRRRVYSCMRVFLACFHYTGASRLKKTMWVRPQIIHFVPASGGRQPRGQREERAGAAPHPLPSKTLARTEEGGA